MFADLLNSSYFALFLIVALGFMLGRIKIKGLSLDVSAVIFIALLFGHFGVIIPKELGNFGLVLFIFTIGIQAGPGFFDSFRSKGKTLIIITLLIICSAALTAVGLKYAFDIDTPSVVGTPARPVIGIRHPRRGLPPTGRQLSGELAAGAGHQSSQFTRDHREGRRHTAESCRRGTAEGTRKISTALPHAGIPVI